MAAKQSTISILDATVALQETTQLEGPEVEVPDSIIDFFQANVITGTNGGNIDPVVLPADTAMGADIALQSDPDIPGAVSCWALVAATGCSSRQEFPGPVLHGGAGD